MLPLRPKASMTPVLLALFPYSRAGPARGAVGCARHKTPHIAAVIEINLRTLYLHRQNEREPGPVWRVLFRLTVMRARPRIVVAERAAIFVPCGQSLGKVWPAACPRSAFVNYSDAFAARPKPLAQNFEPERLLKDRNERPIASIRDLQGSLETAHVDDPRTRGSRFAHSPTVPSTFPVLVEASGSEGVSLLDRR
jgi:hypothetical protein